ncbi:MAG: hypothetical protein E5W31_07090 [Mesorhizobium sp.]|nr:MAG: hypothetical protein E5W31_07090 [Mesorhizobium sp.]
MIDVVYRSQLYLHQLTDGSGRSLTEIASLNATTVSEVSRLLPLAFLSPKIVSKIIAGIQPVELTANGAAETKVRNRGILGPDGVVSAKRCRKCAGNLRKCRHYSEMVENAPELAD